MYLKLFASRQRRRLYVAFALGVIRNCFSICEGGGKGGKCAHDGTLQYKACMCIYICVNSYTIWHIYIIRMAKCGMYIRYTRGYTDKWRVATSRHATPNNWRYRDVTCRATKLSLHINTLRKCVNSNC